MKQNKIPRNEYIVKPKGKTDPYKDGVQYTNLGQWKYPGQVTKIPSNDITMQGVNYPVYGEDDLGYGQMMYPGMDYQFPGQYVTEIPMAQKGKQKGNPISDWWNNTDDVQSTYKMAPDVDPFLVNWLQHPETQKRLSKNLKSNILTNDINPKILTKEVINKLNALPMFSRELVKKADVSQNDIEYNNSLQGWKTPSNISSSNPYFSGDPGELGVYIPNYHVSMVNTFNNPGVITHEQTHGAGPLQKTMEDVILSNYLDKKQNSDKKFVEMYGDYNFDDNYNKVYDSFDKAKQKYPGIYSEFEKQKKYLDKDGMYPRIMDIRRTLNLKPGQKVNKSILDNKSIKLPISDLRFYYDDDTIIDMLNTLAKNNQTKDLNTVAYGGDPSLPNITGHYPFGGQNTKTHTHMQKGGINNIHNKPRQIDIIPKFNLSENKLLEGWNENMNWLGESYKDLGLSFGKGKLTGNIGNYIPIKTFEQTGIINPYVGANYQLNNDISIGANISPDYQGLSLSKTFKNGGWLDEYQVGGGYHPEYYDNRLASGEKYPIVYKDNRKIPQSGVVVDKRTNIAYAVGDNGKTLSFNVMTGANPDLNVNPYTVEQLAQNRKLRGTPVGYYNLEKQLNPVKGDDEDVNYKSKIRYLNPIPAYGQAAPNAANLAFHRLYANDAYNADDVEYNKRLELLRQADPKLRCGSYGCVNVGDNSYDKINKMFPNPDTLMVIDSKRPKDLKLLNQAKKRMKKEEGGEWLDEYQPGGRVMPSETTQSMIPAGLRYKMDQLKRQDPKQKQKLAEEKKYYEDIDKAKEDARKQEVADRKARIADSIEAQKENVIGNPNWREVLARQTQATGDKFRVSDEPNFFDDYINPGVWIGDMASGLGQAPYAAKESNSNLPYALAIGAPLLTGALEGIGGKSTKDFITNIISPVPFTGSMINKGLKKSRALSSKAGSKFKSEIDWGKWNAETPNHPELINEYNAIEKAAKKDGTWMKYSDGTPFKGTPEQFIQMNSSHVEKFAGGKKAAEQMYKQDLHRGAHQHIDDFTNRNRSDYATFLTDNKANAESYAGSDGLSKTYYHPDVNTSGEWTDGIYQLGFPQNSPKVLGEAKGRNWRLLEYDDKIAKGTESKDFAKRFQEELKDNRKLYDYNDYDPNKKYLSTDIYANYVKNTANPEGIAQINNVKDQMGFATNIPTNTVYAVDANRVPIKSLRHNVGFFDMTNPNIYKALVPAAIATGAYQQQEEGGEIGEDEFRRGGQKGLKRFTSKNIQTSINDIMLRNETIYGPSGKRRYKPDLKYDDGGQYSIVNYLAEKGEDFSKEYRKELAKKYGIKDYDFSAEKNLELLNKLKTSKPVSKKETVKEKPKPSYIIKPIQKENAKSTDRTGNVKKVSVPTKEQIAYSQLPKSTKLQIAAQKNAESKRPDELREYVPQGVVSKTWETLSHPMTALTALSQQGYIPDNVSQSKQPNYIDLALDVVNPAFYANAIGRVLDKTFTPSTYSDLGKTAFYLAGKAAGDTQAPEGYDEAAMNTTALAGDVGAVLGLGQMSKALKAEQIAARDAMHNNKITIGKGADKTTVNNSKDFFDYFNNEIEKTGVKRKLKKKEVDFLNKEIKQRGVLEVDRKHPLDPRGLISKSTIIPENYNFKQLLKDVPKVLKESIKKGTPEDLYTMGHGRTAGWNTYLGLPTKNNPYRIHPESFTDGEGLLYTVPDEGLEKLRNLNNELPNVKVYKDLQQSPAKGIEELSFYKKMTSPGAMDSKQLQQEAYDKVFYDMENFAFDNNGDYFYKTQNEIKKALGPKKDFKYSLDLHKKLLNNNVDYISDFPEWVSHESDMFRLGDWDKYIGSHGGVGWKVKKLPNAPYEQWSMEDVWDINPFSRIKKLPFGLQSENLLNKVRRLDAGKILGGKDFKVRLDYLSNPETGEITPMIPKKSGGESTSHDNWLDDI